MAQGLDDVSRLLGQLESKIENVLENQRIASARLSIVETKLSPLDQIASDHHTMKVIQDKHESLVNRGLGFVAAIGMLTGSMGFMIHELIAWGLRKFGLGL